MYSKMLIIVYILFLLPVNLRSFVFVLFVFQNGATGIAAIILADGDGIAVGFT